MSRVSPAGRVNVQLRDEKDVYCPPMLQRDVSTSVTIAESGSMKSANPSPSVSVQTSASVVKASSTSRYPSLSSSVSRVSHMLLPVGALVVESTEPESPELSPSVSTGMDVSSVESVPQASSQESSHPSLS